VTDASERLREVLREEARAAERAGADAALLRSLAETIERMTPAERTWAQEASEEQLREFARTLLEGCAPERESDGGGHEHGRSR